MMPLRNQIDESYSGKKYSQYVYLTKDISRVYKHFPTKQQ